MVKLWARRVWTLELSLVSCPINFRSVATHVSCAGMMCRSRSYMLIPAIITSLERYHISSMVTSCTVYGLRYPNFYSSALRVPSSSPALESARYTASLRYITSHRDSHKAALLLRNVWHLRQPLLYKLSGRGVRTAPTRSDPAHLDSERPPSSKLEVARWTLI